MMGHTHSLIGTALGLGLSLAFHLDAQHSLGLVALGGALALAPDIDHPRAPLRRKLGAVGHVAFGRLKHRGITHTLIALVAVATAAFCLLPLPYALGAAGGYLSHLLADMLTVSGLPVFWPYNRNSLHIIPKRFCMVTNTLPEHVLGLFLLLLMAGQLPHFLG
jgi:inner membrane protein